MYVIADPRRTLPTRANVLNHAKKIKRITLPDNPTNCRAIALELLPLHFSSFADL